MIFQIFGILQFLIIIFSSVLPQIVPFEFGDAAVNVQESVSAMCSVNKGDLPIRIWWSLTGTDGSEKNLSTSESIVIAQTGNKLSVINIESVEARHRGNYTCFARNRAGITQHSAHLAIYGDSIRHKTFHS